MATYSTSARCALAGGMPIAPSTSTYPTEAMIDQYREMAYVQIYHIIATATDSNNVARTVEEQLVAAAIQAAIQKIPYIMVLDDNQKAWLNGEFNSYAIYLFEPDKDGAISG